MKCVQAIRKRERELVRTRAERRKLRQLPKRLREEDLALQDYIHKVGVPDVLKSDNAQSETGSLWTQVSRDQCITNETTEPKHPWQNPAEPQIGALNAMVKRMMAAFNVPLHHHDWCQKWCCDVHNHLASRRLSWRTPMEVNEGRTPDISMFRFHFLNLSGIMFLVLKLLNPLSAKVVGLVLPLVLGIL